MKEYHAWEVVITKASPLVGLYYFSKSTYGVVKGEESQWKVGRTGLKRNRLYGATLVRVLKEEIFWKKIPRSEQVAFEYVALC